MSNLPFGPPNALPQSVVGVLCALLLMPASGFAAGSPASLSILASGLSAPVYLTHAPGVPDRLYIVEQGSSGTGRIKVFNTKTEAVSTFLTVNGLRTGGERGLLGLAFHPDVAANGYFYVCASMPGGGDHESKIIRYTMLDPDSADAASAFPILNFTQPYFNNNGGWVGFDYSSGAPYLYIATGDGGAVGDPQNNAQDITNARLGKILRIDVDADDFPGSPSLNYGIPPSNPFVGVVGDDEIWAYGLRNPWRNSFDRLTGDLYIGDVGEDSREEVAFEHSDSGGGLNHGWRVMEGDQCFDNSQTGGNPPCFDPSFTPPVYEYEHGLGGSQGFSVIGGYVYRGPAACLLGKYFFADYVTDRVWSIRVDRATGQMVPGSFEDWTVAFAPPVGSLNTITSFGEDESGNLYIVSGEGRVFRIEGDCPTSAPPTVGIGGAVFLGAFPNPMRQQTVLRYALDQNVDVRLRVFDVGGRLVRTLEDRVQAVGSHSKTWDGLDDQGNAVGSGVYLAELRTPAGILTERVIVMR